MCASRIRRWVVSGIAALLAVPAHADFRAGVEQYAAGNFDAARVEFLGLAALGDGASQYNLGAMSLQGQGVHKDVGTGVGWLMAAAQNGYVKIPAERLDEMHAKLSTAQQDHAQSIVSRYGREALLRTVLPEIPLEATCPGAADVLASAPEAARRGNAIVIIESTVGVDGRARDPDVLVALPSERAAPDALSQLLRTQFKPAMRGDAPVESRVIARFGAGSDSSLRAEAQTGDASAQYVVGLIGVADPAAGISAARAQGLILSAAQAGNAEAQRWIARRLEFLDGCGQEGKRLRWLNQAALGGNAAAQVELARHLLRGTPTASAFAQVREYLAAGAKSGKVYAQKHAIAVLAASPLQQARSASMASSAARQLARAGMDADPQVLETIAAAHAAAGEYDRAVAQQESAIAKARELTWNTRAMEERLAAYRNRAPWRGELFAAPAT